MASRQRARGEIVLHAALTLLLAGNAFDARRAMVAADFRTLRGQWYIEDARGLLYAVTRTPQGKLAVHQFQSHEAHARIGAGSLTGDDRTDARLVPAPTARPLRTFSSATAAINFMSGQGRAYPTRIRAVGMGSLFYHRNDASQGNRRRVAATAIQSAFRGWRERRRLTAAAR